MQIRIPVQSIVIIVGGRGDPIAEIAAAIEMPSAPWDINAPDASKERLRATVKEYGRARVAMVHAHAKARSDVAAIARKHGAASIVIRLPGAAPVDGTAEKHDAVYDVTRADQIDVTFVPMPSDRRDLAGPFDIIGDVHGVAEEFTELLDKLGYVDPSTGTLRRHPDGRTPVLLGDLTDRGPENKRSLEIARRLGELGGLVILGNHDHKLMRWLQGRDVRVAAGLAATIRELEDTTPEWRAGVAAWLASLQTHLVLDRGRLVVAHAGLAEEYHGRHTSGAQSFALYGKTVPGGGLDDDGFPLAEDWAMTYAGEATVVHGHVVHAEPRIVGNVVAIDTGAVFGGTLTAYRWPERDFIQVAAKRVYFAASRGVRS